MTSSTVSLPTSGIQCRRRPIIFAAAAIALLAAFWFASRYPMLASKAQHVGEAVPTMAYSSELLQASAMDSAWWRILAATVNWLDAMKIGMTFGVLLGALLHTVLRYYPLKIGNNLHLNSLKGALIGVPMGVCANCAVPTACGVTRGNGRVEVALGFLFSSPNFNPVVVTMTFMALPLSMTLTKYALLLVVILGVVPVLIRWLERNKPLQPLTMGDTSEECALPPPSRCEGPLLGELAQLGREFFANVWMLVKPTATLMLLASVVAAVMLVLVPWETLLAEASPLRMAFVSLCAVFMPVPIALDVMFAAQLQAEGVHAGYVMLFAMTLGSYSIIPAVYLWREVSKPLASILFAFFVTVGWSLSLMF